MKPFKDLLIAVWSEACRHIEIAESAARISALLGSHLPIGLLLLRRLDPARRTVTTAAYSDHGDRPVSMDDHEMSTTDCRRALAWIRSGRSTAWPGGRSSNATSRAVAANVPPEVTGHALVAPLRSEHDIMGALIIESRDGEPFSTDHRRVIESLAEPFAAALENDHRLHELHTLREAAEADKDSLLRRLGRDQLVDEIVGADSGLKHVMERVQLVARADAPVLILGETGSGKEVIARAIHNRSARQPGPFIRVNCGAIPPDLIDSELFGHEKGAFTGATSARRGWFERADEGTLFLDEIGELPPPAQIRLLRVVQEGTFERVGGESTMHVNVRIVAATHRDLPAMVQAGRFREDLWYRIAVFPVVLPPLREHKQDIGELAEHFAQRAAKRFGLPPQMPSRHDIALLEHYDWPGNIRELASVIDRAAILGDGIGLEIARALGAPSPGQPPVGKVIADASSQATADLSLDSAMRQHIETVLQCTRGRIEGSRGAAEILGINPHTLRARMRKLQIDWASFRSASPS